VSQTDRSPVLPVGRRGTYELMLRYLIFENERRQILVECIETHEHADAKLTELFEANPESEGSRFVVGTLERELLSESR